MWEERTWAGHEDRKMSFQIYKTSLDRHWKGFEATIYQASAGFDEQSFSEHNVSMYLGRPLLVTTRCDGATSRRLQVPGDVKIVPAGLPRVWETEGATTKLSMFVGPALVCSAATAMGLNPDRVSIQSQLHVNDPQIEHIGWALKAELESFEPFGRLYGESLGLALASHLLRRYAPVAGNRLKGGLSRRRLSRVTEYVRENIGGDLSLLDLADVAGVSPSHFKTLFKQSVGIPVHQYVVRTRVEHAAALLRGDRPLADVALQAGFANQSHMARCMRRIMGISPGRLRCALSS
jgi:AraC family transcriptional regulator